MVSRNLFRHDRMIVINEMRWAFSSWTDRLVAIVVALLALAMLHASLADRPVLVAGSAIAALAAIAGAGAARLMHRRLAFHAYDGTLAAEALDRGQRRAYLVAFHTLALGLLCIAVLAARASLLPLGLAAYLAGAGLGHAVSLMTDGLALRRPLPGRAIRARLQKPGAGVVAAIGLLLLLLCLRTLGTNPRIALAGTTTVIAVLGLTSLDDAVIRFMTLSGYRTWRIVGLHARGVLVFVAIALPVLLVASEPLLTGIIGAVAMAGLALMAMRILAYRIHTKRAADTLVTLCAAAICATGFAASILMPFVAIAIFWYLNRRAIPQTWMLS